MKWLERLKKDNSLLYNRLKKIDYSEFKNILKYIDDNYDIYVYSNYHQTYLGFKVPDFEVYNSNGFYNKISDFVIIPFIIIGDIPYNKVHLKIQSTLIFLRESVSISETNIHPHCMGFNNFTTMCLGSSYHLTSSFFEFDYDECAYNVETFIESLKWESMKGGAYRTINDAFVFAKVDGVKLKSVKLDNGLIRVQFEDREFGEFENRNSYFSTRYMLSRWNDSKYLKNGTESQLKFNTNKSVFKLNKLNKLLHEKKRGEELQLRAERIIKETNSIDHVGV